METTNRMALELLENFIAMSKQCSGGLARVEFSKSSGEAFVAALQIATTSIKASCWRPISEAPLDGTVIWVAGDFSMRLAFWKNGKEYEHRGFVGGGWRDFARAERGSASDMTFDPAYWMPTPSPPSIGHSIGDL